MNEYKLFPYQETGIAWLTQSRTGPRGNVADPHFGLLFDEMGLGKTAQVLRTVADLLQVGKRGLFVVPGATALQWQKNWNRWINDLGTGESLDDWAPNQLARPTSSAAPVPPNDSCVIPHAMLARLPFVKKLIAANFDFIVIDEIHKFGNRRSKRVKNLWALLNLSQSKFMAGRIGMTGTPARNWAHEIYTALHFVAPQYARNFEEFANSHLAYWDQKTLRDPEGFHRFWQPFMLRRTVREVTPDLPKCRRSKVYTELTDSYVRLAYNKELDLMSNFMENSGKVDTISLLGYLQRLRHITGLGKTKQPEIIEPIIDYLTGEDGARKCVIGIHHKWVAERLRSVFKAFTVFSIVGGMSDSEKEAAKLKFISCAAPAVLLLSIKAGGEGIDGLQLACQKAYVFERQWNGADERQFEKRIDRTGQTLPTSVEYTLAAGTVDEIFDEIVEKKRRITNSIEDPNWESDPAFIHELAARVIAAPLGGTTKRGNYVVEEPEEGESETTEYGDDLKLIESILDLGDGE